MDQRALEVQPMLPVMIRMRRLPPTFLRRRGYEVEFIATGDTSPTWSRVTRSPVTLIDPYLGVGDAWALVDKADNAWAGEVGEWVTLVWDPS
jgi:hypothetical protein